MPQLLEGVKKIAERCKGLNIILSRKKIMIGSELPFPGLIVKCMEKSTIKSGFFLRESIQNSNIIYQGY